MPNPKQMKALALTTALAILALGGTADGAEKRRKKILILSNDPYVAFVAGQPFLVAAEVGRFALVLRYPELEVVKTLYGAADKKLDVIKSSRDGNWLAGFFGQGSFRVGGTLRVWNTTTGASYLVLDDASMAFEFIANNRLVVWQPKSGITQWALGESEARRVGTAITSLESVFRDYMYLSADGRYLLIKGACRAGTDPDPSKWELWSYCLYDLDTGAALGWAEDPNSLETSRFNHDFSELLVATNVDLTGGQSNCKEQGKDRVLCKNGGVIKLVELTGESENATDMWGFPAGHTLWEISGRTDFGHNYTSCALSADGRWAAVGVNGMHVLLYDTEQVDSSRHPKLVKHFEMP